MRVNSASLPASITHESLGVMSTHKPCALSHDQSPDSVLTSLITHTLLWLVSLIKSLSSNMSDVTDMPIGIILVYACFLISQSLCMTHGFHSCLILFWWLCISVHFYLAFLCLQVMTVHSMLQVSYNWCSTQMSLIKQCYWGSLKYIYKTLD